MVGESGQDAQFKSGNYVSSTNRAWPTLLKFVELLIAVICIGLLDDPANNSRIRVFLSPRTMMLAYTTFGAFIIICGVYLLGRGVRDVIPWKVSALFNFIGLVLFIACAATILRDWSETKSRNYWPPNAQRLDLMVAAGSLAIIGAFFFLIDTVATFIQGSRGYIE